MSYEFKEHLRDTGLDVDQKSPFPRRVYIQNVSPIIYLDKDPVQVGIAKNLIQNDQLDTLLNLFTVTYDDSSDSRRRHFFKTGTCVDVVNYIKDYLDEKDLSIISVWHYLRHTIFPTKNDFFSETANKARKELSYLDFDSETNVNVFPNLNAIVRNGGVSQDEVSISYELSKGSFARAFHLAGFLTRKSPVFKNLEDRFLSDIVRDPDSLILEPKGLVNIMQTFGGMDLRGIQFHDRFKGHSNNMIRLVNSLVVKGYLKYNGSYLLTNKFKPGESLDSDTFKEIPNSVELEIRRRLDDTVPDRVADSLPNDLKFENFFDCNENIWTSSMLDILERNLQGDKFKEQLLILSQQLLSFPVDLSPGLIYGFLYGSSAKSFEAIKTLSDSGVKLEPWQKEVGVKLGSYMLETMNCEYEGFYNFKDDIHNPLSFKKFKKMEELESMLDSLDS